MRKLSVICVIIGVTLLLSALSLCLYNIHEDKKGGEQAKIILQEIKAEIPEPTEKIDDLFSEYETEEATEATLEIDDSIYIGVIRIPALEIELPVMSEWSYPNLKIAPCRYMGTLYTNDCIICAHNYNTHFGRIGNLHTDDEIIFQDVSGKIYDFQVVGLEQFPATAVEDLQFGDADNWDLTLFTCTLDGRSRVTVRAVRLYSMES